MQLNVLRGGRSARCMGNSPRGDAYLCLVERSGWLVRASLVYDPVTLLKRGEIESEAVIKMQRETHQNKCNGHREN